MHDVQKEADGVDKRLEETLLVLAVLGVDEVACWSSFVVMIL